MNNSAWRMTRDADDIAWLTLDRPETSANTLSRDVLVELDGLVSQLSAAPPRGVVLKSAKRSGFVAGADIREFVAMESAAVAYGNVSAGQHVLDHLEALPCPTVVAMHGFALGGGLELALACQYRVAVGDDRLTLGFPEVMLGLHPGFGGTVRSVRLIGVRAAMDMMLTGKNIRADKALKLGLVDRLVAAEGELDAAARQLVLHPPGRHRPPLFERVMSWPGIRGFVRKQLLAQVRRRVRAEHYPAPYALIDVWSAHGAAGAAAYEAEARSIARLFMSETSRNLVRVFLLQDRLKALGADGKDALPFERVHVVGAGVMGGDIAAWCVVRGMSVTLQDRADEFIQPALRRAEEMFTKRLRDPAKIADARRRLVADVAGDGAAQADVIIEAIFENLDAKRELYARLEPRMKPGAILATNTSSIMLEPLAEKLADPSRLIGLHFFNPVAQMPLVEIVKAKGAHPAAVQRALAFTRKIDKLPLPCNSAPGFLVNRVLVPYLHEAMFAAQEGVPLAVIDQAALDYGMPMGPVELADVVGLDVCNHVGEIVAAALGRQPPDLSRLQQLVAAKKLGRKSGEGFYLWQNGKAVKPPTDGVSAPPDLIDRLILAMLNECVACLREGIVEDADLLDAGVIFGSGFAPFRGGPMHYGRARGYAEIHRRLVEFSSRYGQRFSPDPGWQALLGPAKT